MTDKVISRILHKWYLLFMGFAAGIPFLLQSNVDLWLNEFGFSKGAIGVLAMAHLPYTIRFLLAPIIEMNHPFSFFSKKKGWIYISTFLIITCIMILSFCNPRDDIILLFMLLFVISIAKSLQQAVMYDFEIDRLPESDYGLIAVIFTFGFKLGMMFGSYVVLFFAHCYSWKTGFIVIAVNELLFSLVFLTRPEPLLNIEKNRKIQKIKAKLKFGNSLWGHFISPLMIPIKTFYKEKNWKLIYCVIIFIGTGDALCHKMAQIMYVEIGFSKIEIANFVKLFGMIASIAGGLCVGVLGKEGNIVKALFITTCCHSVTNLFYIFVYLAGHSSVVLGTTIFFENFTGGMVMAAFLSFLYFYSNRSTHSAVIYSFFFSMYSFGRLVFESFSGVLAEALGWGWFFIFAAILNLFVVTVINALKKQMQRA